MFVLNKSYAVVVIMLLCGCTSYQVQVSTQPPIGGDIYIDGVHKAKLSPEGRALVYSEGRSIFANPLLELRSGEYRRYFRLDYVAKGSMLESVGSFKRTENGFGRLYDIVFKTPAPVSRQPLPAPSTHSLHGTRWAVVIGISEYQDTRIPALRYASKDAQSFHKWAVSWQGGYAPARAKILVDKDATAKSIRKALFEWLKQALEEDVVTIFFAGHGSPESPDSPQNLYLLPYDTDYDSIASTAFPMWDIETALKRYIKAKRVIVIADACHSGGVGQSFDLARRAGRGMKVVPVNSGIEKLSNIQEGVFVMTASGDKQLSQEGKQWGGGHGVFTYYLLKGLKGDADFSRDSKVTIGELSSYVSQQVRRATKNAQSPTVAGKYDPVLTIGK